MQGFQPRQQRERNSRQQQPENSSANNGAQARQKKNKPLSPRVLGTGAAANAGFALANRGRQLEEAIGYADGGVVRGPGTGTSDDIQKDIPEGSYIMPADSTEAIGSEQLSGMGAPVRANVSNGEYQMPPEQVHAVGAQVLDQMRDQTHAPTGQPQVEDEEIFFADGGVVEDPKRRISQSRALVPASQPSAAPTPQPASPPTGQPSPGTMYSNSSGQTGRGFIPSSSTAVVPVGPVTTHQPGRSLVPAGPVVEHPRTEGIDPRTQERVRSRVQADTANWQQQRAAQDARFSAAGAPPAAAPRGFRANVMRGAGPVGAVASAIPEAMDVATVAGDPDSTGLDVATQAAEGTARVAGTGAGAALGVKAGGAIGALGGPFAPATVPLGMAAGGFLGGWLGNKLTDGAIDAGRRATGQDTASPAERISGAAPQQPAPVAQQAPLSAAPGGEPFSYGGGQPPAPLANDITREGNSFSAAGPITEGYTINGQAPASQSGQRSPQNEAAVQALMERTPELGQGAGAQQAMLEQEARGFNAGGPRVTVIPDSSRGDDVRRRAIAAASRAMPGAQNGQLTSSQRDTLRSLAESDERNATSRYTSDSSNSAQILQTGMREQGQDRRSASRDQIDSRRLEGEEAARGFQTRAAERVERLYQQYDSAETPEQRSAIAEQLRVLSGNDQAPRFAVAAGGQMLDPTTQQLITQPAQVFNQQTGEFVQQQTSLPPLADNPQVQQILNNTQLSREERARQIRALGYQ